jgi:hypothetical protein
LRAFCDEHQIKRREIDEEIVRNCVLFLTKQ